MTAHFKHLVFAVFIASSILASQSHAHSDHDHRTNHSIDANTAKSNGAKIVAKLIAKKKIAASWKDSHAQSATKKHFGNHDEWVVSFSNPGEKDPAKQTLYIFFSTEGKYIAANFSGR